MATLRDWKSASTCAFESTAFLLYWQVTHQAAVKSTKTGCPDASTCSTRPGSHGCHGPCAWPEVGAVCTRVTDGPAIQASIAKDATANVASTARVRPCKVNAHATIASATSSAS